MKEYIRELMKRKDLLVYLVISGLKAQHRNTFLGYFWWLLDPLLSFAVYFFLIVIVLDRGGENYGAFLVIGIMAWKWIASTVTTSSKSVTGQASIISQVYLPKLMFPIGSCMTQLINFSFGLIVVAVFLAFYQIVPGKEIVWLPFIMVIQQLFLLAIAMVLSYISVFIRDIENILTHIIRVGFYSSPVIWEAGRLPAEYSWIVDINPVSALLGSYRNILMHNSNPEFPYLLLIGATSILIISFMSYYYSRNEHKIIKVL